MTIRYIFLTIPLTITLACACQESQDDDDDIQVDDDDSSVLDTDEDGDGYTEGEGDCDEHDPDVNPGAEEQCNGIDDDCDGAVDEDQPDSDGDGVPDCLDTDCLVEQIENRQIELDPDCVWTPDGPILDPWNIVIEWQYEVVDWDGGVAIPPMVARPEPGEMPNIYFSIYTNQGLDLDELVVLRGDGTYTNYPSVNAAGVHDLLVADVDGDGSLDVVTPEFVGSGGTYDVYLHALDQAGNTQWSSGIVGRLYDQGAVATVVDVDGDGDVEVVHNSFVISGDTGATLADLGYGYAYAFTTTTVAKPSATATTATIVAGDAVYDHNYAVSWDVAGFPGYWFLFHGVGNLDADDDPEIVVVSDARIAIFDPDGSLLHDLDWIGWGAPCIAEFDGNGQAEIAIPGMDDIAMFDNSLSLLWRAPITDQTGASGCSAFDFDADGAYELLYQGEYAFAILDGATGHEHFRWDGHRSVTWMEYPVVADVDDDGSAEVIVASYPREEGDFGGITVFGHADNGWPPAGPYWGISDYAPLRVRPDGTVESPTPDWWNTYNLFKGRPPGDGVPDLVAVEGEVCVASCEEGGLVKVSWGIANQGHVDATGPVSVTLYALNGDAATALQTVQFPDDVRYRYQAPGGTFELSVDEWGDGIRIVVDDDGTGVGTVDECNEDNNAFEIIGPICPIS